MEMNFESFKENEDNCPLEEISEWEARSINMQLGYEIENDLYLETTQEEWRSLNECVNATFNSDVQVSNMGNLRNATKGFNYSNNPDAKGYVTTEIEGKVFKRHRLVMYAFGPIPERNGLVVNHKDGIKTHNWLSNLEWTTQKENTAHAINTNLWNKENRNMEGDFLTTDVVHKICKDLEDGFEIGETAKRNNASFKQVAHIRSKECWTHISSQYDIKAILPARLADEEVIIICEHFVKYGLHPDYRLLAKELNVEYNKKFIRRMYAIRNRENLAERTKEYQWDTKTQNRDM